MNNFGYTDAQWEMAKEQVKEILGRVASNADTISYTELTRLVSAIHFEPHDPSLHYMLGEVSEEENTVGRGMLSVVVVHMEGDMRPGAGFFKMAEKLGKDVTDREV